MRPVGFRMRRLERGTVAGGFAYARDCQGHAGAGVHEISSAAQWVCLNLESDNTLVVQDSSKERRRYLVRPVQQSET